MATRKKTGGKSKKRTARKASTSKAAKAPAKKKKKAPRRPAQKGTEVERCWRAYLDSRTALEVAVGEVRTAADALTRAREAEHARRKAFDEAKRALEALLEVEPAAAGDPRAAALRLSAREDPPPAQPSAGS